MLGGYNSTQLGHVYVSINVNMNMIESNWERGGIFTHWTFKAIVQKIPRDFTDLS